MDEYEFEKDYWGDCCNTFDEDQKHYVYAKFMGLDREHFSFNVHDKKILDIGGGPSSMLLKCKNLIQGCVVDPIPYPEWTTLRYKIKNIDVVVARGEDIDEPEKIWDEVWIYNCLQHTDDPKLIIENAKRVGKMLRIFEWIDVPPHDGHPIELTKEFLDSCIDLPDLSGTVTLAEQGCFGKAYYGWFKT